MYKRQLLLNCVLEMGELVVYLLEEKNIFPKVDLMVVMEDEEVVLLLLGMKIIIHYNIFGIQKYIRQRMDLREHLVKKQEKMVMI